MFPIDVRQAGVDVACSGTYKWLLGGFGVAPFYVRRDLLDRIRLDRFGALHVARRLADDRFELHKTAKRFDYATLPFGEIYQLGAGLDYLERVGVHNIERHAIPLAQQIRAGLASQGHRVLTPEGNQSSIVTYLIDTEPAAVRSAFAAAKVDVTVRDTRQVRVSTALFNTSDDVAKFLEVSKRD
jgi:selenocysteine lyase/cysteine desulfurase